MSRLATVLIGLGLVAVVLAALPNRIFELDRFFVPKELTLHVVALGLALLLVYHRERGSTDVVDWLLAFFLGWSVLSSVFATNHWLAQRALAVSVASAVVFWCTRRLAAGGTFRAMMYAAAFATVVAAATGLAQVYGFESQYFSQNRAPGGTFGNRNFVAHFVIIGMPSLVWVTVTARSMLLAFAGTLCAGAAVAFLMLTRSRAAWLAAIVAGGTLAFTFFMSRRYWRGTRTGGRLARIALTATVAVCIAIILPNQLNWRSDSPYIESALAVTDYSSGSGLGRIAQYRNSLEMAKSDPLFGTGPGNWPVKYPRFAPSTDRSLTADGMTANPWPSSDWVAFLAERGIVAALALLALMVVIFVGSLRRWRDLATPDLVLAKVALGGTIAAVMVTSAFDAVLTLGAPALLAWTVIGTTSGIGKPGSIIGVPPRWWSPLIVGCAGFLILSLARSGTQLVAITKVGNGGQREGWRSAASWDPGSYRVQMRTAELMLDRGGCREALPYASQASGLFPHAAAPKRMMQRCSRSAYYQRR